MLKREYNKLSTSHHSQPCHGPQLPPQADGAWKMSPEMHAAASLVLAGLKRTNWVLLQCFYPVDRILSLVCSPVAGWRWVGSLPLWSLQGCNGLTPALDPTAVQTPPLWGGEVSQTPWTVLLLSQLQTPTTQTETNPSPQVSGAGSPSHSAAQTPMQPSKLPV